MKPATTAALDALSGSTHFEDAARIRVEPGGVGVWQEIHSSSHGFSLPFLVDRKDREDMLGWEDEIAFEVYDD